MFDYLSKQGTIKQDSLKWVSSAGLTPGYDIEYKDFNNSKIGIEVKATTAKLMYGLELTSNEYVTMKEMKDRFILAIVTDVEGLKPQISFINNLATKLENSEFELIPLNYRLLKLDDNAK